MSYKPNSLARNWPTGAVNTYPSGMAIVGHVENAPLLRLQLAASSDVSDPCQHFGIVAALW